MKPHRRALARAGLLALAACGGGELASPEEPRELRVIRAVELPDALAARSDERPVVLNLWATWCAPCVAELPAFSRVAAARDDVAFLGLSADWAASSLGEEEDLAKVSGVWRRLGMNFDSWYLRDTLENLMATLALEDGVLPQTHLVRHGVIVASHAGDFTEEELRAWLAAALAE